MWLLETLSKIIMPVCILCILVIWNVYNGLLLAKVKGFALFIIFNCLFINLLLLDYLNEKWIHIVGTAINGIKHNMKCPGVIIAYLNPNNWLNLSEVIYPNNKLPATYPICWKTACKNEDSYGFLNYFIPKASVLISWTETQSPTINNNKAVWIWFYY